MDQKTEDFYIRLKQELENTTEQWPSEYLFKFIVPNTDEKPQQIEKFFDGLGAVIKNNPSKNGKYMSVSVNAVMKDADAIIEKYKQVAVVEGVISL